ncbi:uncharacterized protein LOC133925576 [Phragmites australis]|uniref:uncharacterized protein LOC133925576 n=1 Tax=Phragmites australis TaxID=29695 RepID=UPI002D76D9EC|nr:uncharacterized protein LOC133925576 [Phragmites australis]
MPSLSSPLAPKGQLKLATAVLLILVPIVLFASSCEARGLRVHGNNGGSSKSPLPGKDVASCLKVDGCLKRQTGSRSEVDTEMDHHMVPADAKVKEGVAMASHAGEVRATIVGRVSQRLSRQEDAGFHLDYAGPRTHPPSHN